MGLMTFGSMPMNLAHDNHSIEFRGCKSGRLRNQERSVDRDSIDSGKTLVFGLNIYLQGVGEGCI